MEEYFESLVVTLLADPSTVALALCGRLVRFQIMQKAGRLKNARGSLRLGLARDETLPRLVALVNNLERVLAVLGLAGEGELVLGLRGEQR